MLGVVYQETTYSIARSCSKTDLHAHSFTHSLVHPFIRSIITRSAYFFDSRTKDLGNGWFLFSPSGVIFEEDAVAAAAAAAVAAAGCMMTCWHQ